MEKLTQEEMAVVEQTLAEWTEDKYSSGHFVEFDDGGAGFEVQHERAVRWCVQGYLAKVMGFEAGSEFFTTALAYKLGELAVARLPEEGRSYFYRMVGSASPLNAIAETNNTFGHGAAVDLLKAALAA